MKNEESYNHINIFKAWSTLCGRRKGKFPWCLGVVNERQSEEIGCHVTFTDNINNYQLGLDQKENKKKRLKGEGERERERVGGKQSWRKRWERHHIP
jgi:hypothetical protein